MRRLFYGFAVALVAAATPALLVADDSEIARQIAAQLHQSGHFAGQSVSVRYDSGKLYLKGRVSTKQQVEQALAIGMQRPDVEQVVNLLEVGGGEPTPAAPEAASEPRTAPAQGAEQPSQESLSERMSRVLGGGSALTFRGGKRNDAEPQSGRVQQAQRASQTALRSRNNAWMARQVNNEEQASAARSTQQIPTTNLRTKPIQRESAGRKDNRQIATEIANELYETPGLEGLHLGVKFENGTAWIRGDVAHPAQISAARAIVQGRPEVKRVVNQLSVAEVQQAAFRKSAPQRRPMPMGGQQVNHSIMQDQGVSQPMPAYTMPVGNAVRPMRYDQPHLPNYAWPSYAAYPNYAGLTYPTQYSPTAWPYIGPFYPYPQVPLGWRKVTLEWDDGWWWLDFKDTNCCK